MDVQTDSSAQWHDWPCCPACSRRRQAICPVCDVAGTDFSRGFYPQSIQRGDEQTSADEQPPAATPEPVVLLVCPSCDEVFAPRFYRYCQQCGHDFGQGIEVLVPASERLPPRVYLVLAALLGLGLVFWWYLWRTLR